MAETRTLSQFKSKLIGGGTRPNLFEVSIPTFPSAISEAWSAGDDSENGIFKFLCKATALPASNLGSIEIPFRGRILKVLETEHLMIGQLQLSMMKTLNSEQHLKDGQML